MGSLCQCLVKTDIQTTLVIGVNINLDKEWINPSKSSMLKIHILKSKLGYKSWLTKQNLIELNKFLIGINVVHLHGAWDIGNIQLSKILKQLKIPYIVSPHGMLTDWSLDQKKIKKSIFLFLLGNRFFKDSFIVHCTSMKELNQTKHNIPDGDNFICVPPIVYQDKNVSPDMVFKVFPNISKSKFKILFLGRIHPVKGIEALIESCLELKKYKEKFQMIIAGTGERHYVNELKKMVEYKNLKEEIIWIGMVKNPLKDSLLNACQIFVLPSLHESFGIVLAEAGLAGLPIITTKHVGIYKELKNAGAVILPIKPKKISEEIIKFVRDKNMLKNHQISKKYFQVWLNKDTIVHRFINIYSL